jgi:hypothetical protein
MALRQAAIDALTTIGYPNTGTDIDPRRKGEEQSERGMRGREGEEEGVPNFYLEDIFFWC